MKAASAVVSLLRSVRCARGWCKLLLLLVAGMVSSKHDTHATIFVDGPATAVDFTPDLSRLIAATPAAGINILARQDDASLFEVADVVDPQTFGDDVSAVTCAGASSCCVALRCGTLAVTDLMSGAVVSSHTDGVSAPTSVQRVPTTSAFACFGASATRVVDTRSQQRVDMEVAASGLGAVVDSSTIAVCALRALRVFDLRRADTALLTLPLPDFITAVTPDRAGNIVCGTAGGRVVRCRGTKTSSPELAQSFPYDDRSPVTAIAATEGHIATGDMRGTVALSNPADRGTLVWPSRSTMAVAAASRTHNGMSYFVVACLGQPDESEGLETQLRVFCAV